MVFFFKLHIFCKMAYNRLFPCFISQWDSVAEARTQNGGWYILPQLVHHLYSKTGALDTALWQTTFPDELSQNTHLHCLLSTLQNKLYTPPPHPTPPLAQRRIETAWQCKSVFKITAVTDPGKPSIYSASHAERNKFYKRRIKQRGKTANN